MEKYTKTNSSQCGRNIVYDNNENISLYSYAKKMIDVYGDNAKIGLCFLMATLFKDIIVQHTKSFPILNLCGPKGTGKSEMGHSLMLFFTQRATSFNLKYSKISDLNNVVARGSNVLVHLDEFDNSIGIKKCEFLKCIWDNTGLSRIKKGKEREFTHVGNGVIVSGQGMATSDIALFSRFIFLSFTQTEHNDEERKRFLELMKIEILGLSHLTSQILRWRREMDLNFNSIYNECATDVSEAIKQRYVKVEERIFRNWLILVATLKTLHKFITLPFSYDNIRELCVDMMISQSKIIKNITLGCTSQPLKKKTIISKLMTPNGSTGPEDHMRFLFFKDGMVNIIMLKEHVSFIFEPKNKHGYKIIRIYKKSGKLIKQWKGLSFADCLNKNKLFQKNNAEYETTIFPISLTLEDGVELSFYSENGSTIWGFENKELSIYDIFTNLQKYK